MVGTHTHTHTHAHTSGAKGRINERNVNGSFHNRRTSDRSNKSKHFILNSPVQLNVASNVVHIIQLLDGLLLYENID